MTAFDDAMKASEAALLARRHPAARKPTKNSAHLTTPTLNGVELATLARLEATNQTLRDDLNAVLDGLDSAPRAAPAPLQITINDNEPHTVDGLTHYQLPDLIRLCAIRPHVNILLKGEMGSGKSTAAVQVAEALGLSFSYIGQTLMPHDVLGYMHPVTSEYVWTALTTAFVHGGVCVLEEMDGWSANATLVANPFLAGGMLRLPNGEMHSRHADCVIIACTNTWGTGPTAEYVGRNKLDNAFLDRFGVRMDWRYDYDLERAAAGNDGVVDVVQQARRNAKQAGIKVAISPRASIDVSKLVGAGFALRDALNMNFLSALDADQRKTILAGCEV